MHNSLHSLHSAILAHFIALFLVVLAPAWDHRQLQSLRRLPTASARLRYYRSLAAWLWILTVAACWVYGFNNLLTVKGLGIDVSWLQIHHWAWYLLAALVAAAVIIQVIVPLVQVTIQYRQRAFLEPKQFEPLRFFLPNGPLERRWYALLSLTAGVTEELLFRGFLLTYLHTWPIHFSLVYAIGLSTFIFGIHHLYQGRIGFLSTTLTGLIFTLTLLVTKSLWPGMAFHAAIDLSLLLYWRPKPAAPKLG